MSSDAPARYGKISAAAAVAMVCSLLGAAAGIMVWCYVASTRASLHHMDFDRLVALVFRNPSLLTDEGRLYAAGGAAVFLIVGAAASVARLRRWASCIAGLPWLATER